MNVNGLVGIVLLVTGMFIAIGLIIDDFETNYIETNISQASEIDQSLNNSLVTASDINETVYPLLENIEDLSTQEGFWDILGDGTIVLSALFINFLLTMASFIGLGEQQIIAILQFIGIPPILIGLIVIALICWIIFKAVEMERRYPS